jgi:hypothetical protein
VLRSTERYWYFSMGVFFISSRPRPCTIVSSNFFSCSVPISLLTSLHLVLVAVDTGRGETVGPEVPPGLVLVGSAVVGTVVKVSIAIGAILVKLDRFLRRRVDMTGRTVRVGVAEVGGRAVVCVGSHGVFE